MWRLIFPLLIVLFLGVALVFRRAPLIRGTAGDVFVSPNRPAVAVAPGPGFRLSDARRADLSLRGESLLHPARGALWYALWVNEAAPSRLMALICLLEDPWRWPTGESSGFRELRSSRAQRADADLECTVATFVLSAAQDPWRAREEAAPWSNGSLTRRFTFRAWHSQAKLIVEYREPLPAVRPEDDPAALSAFEARADVAFHLLRGSPKNPLPRPSANLPYPPEGVDRAELAAYLGETRCMDK